MKKAYEKRTIVFDFETKEKAEKWLKQKVKEINNKREHNVLNFEVYNNSSYTFGWSAEITYHVDYVALRFIEG